MPFHSSPFPVSARQIPFTSHASPPQPAPHRHVPAEAKVSDTQRSAPHYYASSWRGSPPDMRRNAFEGLVTGAWHDRAPRETRLRPDYSGLVTLYDPSLSSLVEARYGKDRLHLRLEGISALDTDQVRDELRTVFTRERDGGSGIDRGSIVRVVTERYAGRLEHLRFLLSSNTSSVDPLERATVAREQLFAMLAPYITTTDIPKRLLPSANLKLGSTCRAALRRDADVAHHIPPGMLTRQSSTRSMKYVGETADEVGATGAFEMSVCGASPVAVLGRFVMFHRGRLHMEMTHMI
ncbi:hypothetical protein EDB83DRAFT_2555220 [Lactarius deliciosus]|nr:hypothetical protein EDB83DRAFT_2555220 [Lactarius deliciosus]